MRKRKRKREREKEIEQRWTQQDNKVKKLKINRYEHRTMKWRLIWQKLCTTCAHQSSISSHIYAREWWDSPRTHTHMHERASIHTWTISWTVDSKSDFRCKRADKCHQVIFNLKSSNSKNEMYYYVNIGTIVINKDYCQCASVRLLADFQPGPVCVCVCVDGEHVKHGKTRLKWDTHNENEREREGGATSPKNPARELKSKDTQSQRRQKKCV